MFEIVNCAPQIKAAVDNYQLQIDGGHYFVLVLGILVLCFRMILAGRLNEEWDYRFNLVGLLLCIGSLVFFLF